MKKTFMKICGVGLSMGIMLATISGCGETDGGKTTVDFGSTYRLSLVNGATYTVYNPNGEEVELLQDGFLADTFGEYKIVMRANGNTIVSRVVVADLSAPILRTSHKRRYAAKGTPIALPEVIATDNADSVVQTEKHLFFGQEELILGENFVFEQTGEYRLDVSAKDTAGNQTVKSVEYIVVDALSERLQTVADFSSPYGVQQLYYPSGYNVSWQDEIAYANESGATKLKINGDRTGDQSIRLQNAIIRDLSEYQEMYMYVYNAGRYPLQFSVNYAVDYTLLPQTWNEIRIKSLDLLGNNSHNSALKETFDCSNINGLAFATFDRSWAAYEQAEIYLSNLYALPYGDPEEIDNRILALGDTITPEQEQECAYIERKYTALSETKRAELTQYDSFKKNLLNFYFQQYEITETADKAFYFDTPYGVKQTNVYAQNGQDNIVDAIASYTVEKAYGEEQGSTQVVVKNTCWNANVELLYPHVELDEYTKMYFFVYIDEGEGKTYQLDNNVNNRAITLNGGEWTRVEISLEKGVAFTGKWIRVYCNHWDDVVAANTTFYISAVYLEK